jgi:hypothetical protein
MAHKKHNARVPPSNQPKGGPNTGGNAKQKVATGEGAPFEEQDAKRRLGGYETAGEHSIQQPSDLNDGTHHDK